MAYSLRLSGAPDQDGPETFHLCSIGRWGLFQGWVLPLPPGEYPALRSLALDGRCAGTDGLAAELLDAGADLIPADAGAVLGTLRECVGEAGHPDEVAEVVD